MTGASLAAELVEHGMDPVEGPGKETLYKTVLDAHAMLRGGVPGHAWWVPGRLEVFGKHTDYAGGRTLVCAVPRGFAVVASPRADRSVRVHDATRGDAVTLDPTARAASHAGWRRYAEVAVRRLARNFPECAFGADIVLASDLPRASGMSSSSALVIAVAGALGAIGAVHEHHAWIANIRTPLDVAAYYASVENGLAFRGLDGDAGVGTHGGSEDHTAILEGRPGHVSAFAFIPPCAIEAAKVPDDWSFVLAPSGAVARKTGDALGPYNWLAAGIDVLLTLWNGTSPDAPAASLAAALARDDDGGDRLNELVRRSSLPAWSPDALQRRLEHFIREDARVPVALAAFRDRDGRTLRTLSAESQHDAEVLLGNQVPETIALAYAALDRGALAACSFGAGFGGSVWALTEAGRANAFAARWCSAAFVAPPGPPLTRLLTVNS